MNTKIRDHALEHLSDEKAVEIEDTLWWFQGRKAIIRSYLKIARRFSNLAVIMDIGCGSGGNLGVLSEFGKVFGLERSTVLAQRARSRGIASAVIEKDAGDISESKDVQLFTFFDVLEHVEHDSELLKKIRASAPQPHLLLISVPASPFLYGEHDKILHHYRRYSRRTLHNCLSTSGYRVLKIHYFMSFLFPFAVLERLKDQFFTAIGRERQNVNIGIVPPIVNNLLTSILELEAAAAGYIFFPAGLWLFALAEKQD
jgi:SAM-dependent methyltransferase